MSIREKISTTLNYGACILLCGGVGTYAGKAASNFLLDYHKNIPEEWEVIRTLDLVFQSPLEIMIVGAGLVIGAVAGGVGAKSIENNYKKGKN